MDIIYICVCVIMCVYLYIHIIYVCFYIYIYIVYGKMMENGGENDGENWCSDLGFKANVGF
jgi:hypothetical protein